ncbi:hypothetical protein [Halorubrum tebenquichense]|uniref:Uncharacterized protein n=1 Tax=Halorubrum tebenquichense DSM 14210 TaxID=1227485 RepID=M0DKQ3_9EURY|nr:hypothetical protein [Halorubrum tebenquichense]ELZ35398.1 hypothetical protein C472_12710 [Halorubrum tebenquichense DSM 14210]
MPSQATHTIDVTELGFDESGAIEIRTETTADSGTVVTAECHGQEWTLTFDEYGELTDKPARAAPRWLGPAIKKAAPQLRVA